ncbi:MAG: hypothetical protein NTV22_08030 [bacterium]|nr:hypothetical protein [bacterium]
MKTLTIMLIGLSLTAAMPVAAQPMGEPRTDERRPPRGANEPSQAAALTGAQQEQVRAILSKYDAASLTADEARAIHEAFRKAGLRGGPAMGAAITAAGFAPAKLRDLAPPPGQGGGRDQRPPDREDARIQGGDNQDQRGQEQRSPGGEDQRGQSGDRQAQRGQDQRGQEPRGQGQGQYSIEQAISDRAQLNTIAFDGLAFLTGNMGCNTFLPPGKVADFCGFQYMRDVDSNQLGHNTSFVPRAANNVLSILTDEQKAQLVALAKEQEPLLTEFAHKRFPLIQAFCRQLEGNIPSGSAGLNRAAVMKYTTELYEIDGRLSYRRAEVLGGIVRALTDTQKSSLAKMVFNNSATWPEIQDQVDKKSMSHTAHVAVMTYASEMFSWYAGNVEADVYFCPERHATYFGSFYMKDIPAMGNANYSISTSLTGDSGEAFLAALTEPQRALVTGLVEQQRADLAEIVKTRRAIATALRQFMKQASVDKDKVLALSRKYGELDGEISYDYAMAFAQVARTLTANQKTALLKLRNLDAKYVCKGAYLYSRAIAMPDIPNTDFLFGVAGAAMPVATAATVTAAAALPVTATTAFTLRSPAVASGGALPPEFTGGGASATLPLEWRNAPAGTKSYALVMHHVAPDQTKWYVYTIYALSAPPQFTVPPAQVNREVLLAVLQDRVLARAELSVIYARQGIDAAAGGAAQ